MQYSLPNPFKIQALLTAYTLQLLTSNPIQESCTNRYFMADGPFAGSPISMDNNTELIKKTIQLSRENVKRE